MWLASLLVSGVHSLGWAVCVWLFGWDLLRSDEYLDDADFGLQASVFRLLPQDENVHAHFTSSLQDHNMLLSRVFISSFLGKTNLPSWTEL